MNSTADDVSDLVRGQVRITSEIARQLEAALSGSAAFWINREFQYRKELARLDGSKSLNVAAREWLHELPLKEMIKFAWLDISSSSVAAQTATNLKFFEVPNIETWQQRYDAVLESAAFKTSPTFKSQPSS